MSPRHLMAFAALTLIGCAEPAQADNRFIPNPADPSAKVEYFIDQPPGSGPWPTILFLHGNQNGLSTPGGRVYADWGVLRRYAGQGYLSVSVSLPGFGASHGPADFAGPYTQEAVAAVLAELEAEGLAEPGRVLLYGVSLGAVTAGLLAAADPDIDGLVLISGLYDLPAFLDRPQSPGAAAVKAAALRQTGGDPDALRSRSLLAQVASVRAAALILNGAADDRTDPEQALRLAEALNTQGRTAKVVIYADYGHEIPVAVRQKEIDAFIDQNFPVVP